ncbi:LysR substrate-binding domain-containing protein [Verminephrobacter eiseniae]|uniref:LysR substrate-binding domain-containing protein n=1 Tax=Verminephrobacter eiseniae TaxID=364317 RepID=UPI00223836F3|nr:LysR substrate-binding domain-containing protein [Verminephrobacter eiseniae]
MALKVLSSDGLLRSLIDGEIDIAVAPLTSQLPEAIRSHTLFDELTSIVCRKWHPILACDGAAMPKEIAACAWILPSTQVSARQRIDAYFRKHKLHGLNAMVENTYGSPVGVFMLIANIDLPGICCAQHHRIAEQFDLEAVRVPDLRWTRKIVCLVRKAGALSERSAGYQLVAGNRQSASS